MTMHAVRGANDGFTRINFATLRYGMGATRVKMTALRWIGGGRRFPGQANKNHGVSSKITGSVLTFQHLMLDSAHG